MKVDGEANIGYGSKSMDFENIKDHPFGLVDCDSSISVSVTVCAPPLYLKRLRHSCIIIIISTSHEHDSFNDTVSL